MKRSIYFLAFLTVALLFLAAGSVVKADGLLDPKVGLGPSGSCSENNQTSLTQSFSGLQTDCVNDFTNQITSDDVGVTLFQLVVTIAGGPFDLTCETLEGAPLLGPAFQSSPNSCTFQETQLDAITPGLTYGLTFDPAFGSTVDITLSQQVITPEPATLLLFGTGVMAYVANKKRPKAAKQSL
jgi:hypothetical protein